MLTKIRIEGLFNQFNYDIELKPEGLTILTGPNGYGKTTILKIIHAFATKNLIFFFQLPFREIVLTLEEDEIKLLKIKADSSEIQLSFKELALTQEDDELRHLKAEADILEIQSRSKPSNMYKKSEIIPKQIERLLLTNPQYKRVGVNQWRDRETDTLYTKENLIDIIIENNPQIQAEYYKEQLPDFVEVYLIKEQRLIRTGVVNRRRISFLEEIGQSFSNTGESFSNTIKEHAKELAENIKDIQAKASKIGQELDSSFPSRLFDATSEVSEADFNERYKAIRAKQQALSLYGLSATQENRHTPFKLENAKALLVYLNDTEQKLEIYNDLLKKLEPFVRIVNEKKLVSKQLEISPELGFRFKTLDNQELALTHLSSGEQQEVVLLYELLFKVKLNTLLLIDEPEISLHVAWQKRFLDDLLEIIKLQKITAIVATHSPQIIGNKWDLEVDLYDLIVRSEEVSK